MNDKPAEQLSPDEILFQINNKDLFRLEEIVHLLFGVKFEEMNWEQVFKGNSFPARQYTTALQATNEGAKPRLVFVDKQSVSGSLPVVYVKKGPFFTWAIKEWPDNDRVIKTVSIWEKYKKFSASTSPSLLSNKAIIKNHGDAIQIREFIEHCKLYAPEKYEANITKIAKQTKGELKKIKLADSTYKKHTVRMPLADLLLHAEAAKSK